jgi:hypothetical protein
MQCSSFCCDDFNLQTDAVRRAYQP